MKINNKSAFTIAELIITTVIMAVVMVIAPIITLKRAVKPAVAKKFDFIAICTTKCIFDTPTTTIKTQKNDGVEEKTRLDYNKNSNEFYTIELVGGGGGGTANSFGFPGESRILFLPSLGNNEKITNSSNAGKEETFGGILTGYYLMEAGTGGAAGKTGNPSRVCIISKTEAQSSPTSLSCDGKIIIATAKGGIISNENAEFFGESNTQKEASTVATEKSAAQEEKYGWGGDKSSAGNGGVIVIK